MNDLVIWQGGNEKYEVSIDYLSVNSDFYSINNKLSTDVLTENKEKGIDVYDIKFSSKVKTADKQDYLFAIFSGLVAAAFDQFAVGRTDLSKIKDLDKKELFAFARNVLLFSKYSDKAVEDLESEMYSVFDNVEEKIQRAPKYKELAKDFRDSLSVKGLFFAIFTALTGYSIGENEKGSLSFVRDENAVMLKDKNPFQKIELGFVSWLIKQAIAYNETGKYQEEIHDLLAIKGSLSKIKDLVKALASTKLFKDKSIDKTEIYRKLFDKVSDDTKDLSLETKKYSLDQIFTKQMIPVLLDKCLVRTYLFIKLLISDLNEKNVKSIEGLNYINISLGTSQNKRLITRMDPVSLGVFAAVDGAEALLYASREAKKAAEKVAAMPVDDNTKAAMAVAAAVKEGVFAFASSINVVNVFEFIAVVKADSQYLIEDVNNYISREVAAKQIALQKAREQDQKLIIDATKLKKTEIKILYSLELDLLEKDIINTKDSETQILKDEWKKEWMKSSEDSMPDINKLFYDDADKVYAQINTKAGNQGDISWIYRVALELMCFAPYASIDPDNPKKYSKLKLSKYSYIDNVFCNNQSIVSKKDMDEMDRLFAKYYNTIGGSTGNVIKGVAGTLVVTAAAAAAAFAFAPAIAVALVGSSFAGLSGAALTSASLALLGGGAVAAGGLGMAGGTLVIAGGGALLGLGASGATLGSLIFLSSSKLIQNDYAKLLTTCDYIFINKCNMLKEVQLIKKQVEESVSNYSIQIELIKNSDSFNDKKVQKNLVKEMEKSLDVVSNANVVLDKLLSKNVVI